MRNEIGAALGPAGMHDELACDVIERSRSWPPSWPDPAPEHADRRRVEPTHATDKDASAPRSRRHRGERYRRPRPGPCATEAGAQRARSQPRFAAPSACAAAAATGSFFSQRLGELRSPDIDEFALFDLGDEARDRPVCTVRDGPSSSGAQTRSAASVFTGGGPADRWP